MDRHTKQQRSYNMSRVKAKNTGLEIKVFRALEEIHIAFQKHYNVLGRPDISFPDRKLAVFIDSDFWHGWHFDKWKSKLSRFWFNKISDTRKRDRLNNKKLRSDGWTVLRIWEHQLNKNFDFCIKHIIEASMSKK